MQQKTHPSFPLVGTKAFVRLLSGRIGQHHLHLYSINNPTVEHRHGLICTLRERLMWLDASNCYKS